MTPAPANTELRHYGCAILKLDAIRVMAPQYKRNDELDISCYEPFYKQVSVSVEDSAQKCTLRNTLH